MDIETHVPAASEHSQLPSGPTERIKSCTWPGSDKFMKSSHPHENTVYFNLPSGNKSILNFCGRSLGLALLLREDEGICLHGLPCWDSVFLWQETLNSPLCPHCHRASWTSNALQVYKLVIDLGFTNTTVGTRSVWEVGQTTPTSACESRVGKCPDVSQKCDCISENLAFSWWSKQWAFLFIECWKNKYAREGFTLTASKALSYFWLLFPLLGLENIQQTWIGDVWLFCVYIRHLRLGQAFGHLPSMWPTR